MGNPPLATCGHGKFAGEKCKECQRIYLTERIKIKRLELDRLEHMLLVLEFGDKNDKTK